MFRKFAAFWRTFWTSFKDAYNTAFKEPVIQLAQEWRDVKGLNLLAVCVNKLVNLALTEATFELMTDSTQAEPLVDLCADLEAKAYTVAEEMLGNGDYWVFPSTDASGRLYHSYLSQQQVRVLNMSGDRITEACGIIDWYVDSKTGKTFYLLRRHILDEKGTLTITYTCEDAAGKPAELEQWAYITGETVQYINANHIGFGRFKSPVSSRGLSPVYGVPLNFGCAELEEQIAQDFALESEEVRNATSKIFTDPRNLIKDEKGRYQMTDNIFAVQQRAGTAGSMIDVYSPPVRFADFNAKTREDLRKYEQQMGIDRGFLTETDVGTAVTATEIRRANASTISMLERIHNAMAEGAKETLEADAVFLNVGADLYNLKVEWYDPFDDPATQWQRLLDGHNAGAVEVSDLTSWLFPELTEKEIAEKLERIGSKAQANTDMALENILGA